MAETTARSRRRLRRLGRHLRASAVAAWSSTPTTRRSWAGFGIGSYGGPGTAPTDSRHISPAEHRILFVDDDAVASMTGIVRRLNAPTICGAVITPAATGGRFNSIDGYTSPQFNPEKGLWEWWVRADNIEGPGPKPPGAPIRASASPAPPQPEPEHAETQSAATFAHPDELIQGGENTIFPQTSITYYCTSTDGERWEFPSLGLCELEDDGSRDHSILTTPRGEALRHVVRDEREPDPAKRCTSRLSVPQPQPQALV